MPAVGFKPFGYAFAEGKTGKALDRYFVIVVKVDQLSQFEMAGEGSGFRRNTFHQITIGNDCVDMVIDYRKLFLVESCGKMGSAHSHAHTISKTLAQGPGSDFHSWRQKILRMAWRFRAPLAEILDFIQREIIARQIKQRIDQHRAVPGREEEAIPILPLRVVRIVAQKTCPEHIRHWSSAERQTGMP